MPLLASIVVPTYKRPALLDRCLAAILAQDADPASYEVIVADDADSGKTRGQVLEWALRFEERGTPLHYVAVGGPPHGPAAARNRGWRAAAGAVVAFTDDDCVPAPGWLAAGLEALAKGADAAWGRLVMPLPPNPTDYELDAAGLASAEFVTANCFCRKDALRAVGGFDEGFTAAWREDSDLYFSLMERGFGIVHAPKAVVEHPVRPAPWGVSVAQQRKSRFEARLFKKHPALYRAKVRPSRPWHYYPILAAGLAAAGFGLAGRKSAAGACAALWAALTARFALRRLARTARTPRHVAEMLATSALIPPLSVFWRVKGAAENRVLFF